MKPLNELSTTELVKMHNSLVPPTKAVKRFSTKDAAVRRVQALLDAKAASSAPAGKAEPAETDERAASDESPVSAPSKAARQPRKSTVYVKDGPGAPKQYRSVFVAFEALGLPIGKHQKFRAKLKASGQEQIDRYTFYTSEA